MKSAFPFGTVQTASSTATFEAVHALAMEVHHIFHRQLESIT